MRKRREGAPVTNMAKWDRAMKRQLDAIREQVDVAHGRLGQLIFDKVVEFSPKFTGLFAANHEVHLKPIPFRVFPEEDEREEPGQFFTLIRANRDEQIQELTSKSLPDKFTIGNGVSYGDKIENLGDSTTGSPPVYLNARNLGIAIFNAEQDTRGTVPLRE